MPDTFTPANLAGQAPWELRGVNEDRLRSLETSRTADEAAFDAGYWVAYVPTFTNFTLGNGSVAAAYKRYGHTVHYRGEIHIGSTSNFTGQLRVSAPFASPANLFYIGAADCEDNDAGVARTCGTCEMNPNVWGQNIAFFSTGAADWSGTIPITFAVSDIIRWNITYEAA